METTTPPATKSQRAGAAKDLLLAFSLANLVFVETWSELLFDADGGYFNRFRVESHTLLALLANLAWATLLGWGVLRAVRRTRSLWARRLVVVVVTALLLQAANYVRVMVLGWSLGGLLRFGGLPAVVSVAVAGLLFLLIFHSLAGRILTAVLAILSPLAFLTVGRVLLVLLGVTTIWQHEATSPQPAAFRPNAPEQPRVVWIIFDEMDYRLAFAERPARVKLPEFDRLCGEAVHLTHAYAPGSCTMISLPALTTGRMVLRSKTDGPSTLRLRLAENNELADWGQLTNVFDRALALGFNTAAVGWYHPYDRILGHSLTRVTWHPFMWFEMVRGPDFATCLRHQITAVSFMEHRRRMAADFQQALKEAVALATNRTVGLSLFHLPTPHPPGIYDAARQRFSVTRFSKRAGYLDNLMLADRALGRLRQAMETAGVWTNTWLIATADHWWRQSGSPDHRIPFILKPPAPARDVAFTNTVNTVITSDLILAILRGEITNETAAVSWLSRHTVNKPPTYQTAAETGD